MSNKHWLSVGEVSRRSGVAVSALHFYEAKGLIKSNRTPANHRRYSRTVLRKISVIKAAQKAGIPLDEVARQLSTIPNDEKVSSEDWKRLSSTWKAELDDRIERLMLLRDTLTYCIGCGCLSEKYCDLVNPDDAFAKKGTGPQLLDPKGVAEFKPTFEKLVKEGKIIPEDDWKGKG